MHAATRWLGMFALLLAAAGCSKSTGVKQVSGSVTLDGNPLAGAHVEFVPKTDLKLGAFGGLTDDKGNFSIAVGGPGMAAKPGTYVVLVTKGAGLGFPPPKSSGDDEERTKELMKMGPRPGMGSLPGIYSSKETSPFTVEIKEGATELSPFALKTKP